MSTIRNLIKSDLHKVNGIISRAFTQGRIDDGYVQTQVPMCRPEFLDMYFTQCPQGCFIVEEKGQIQGAAFCHVWGKTGWIGPIAIVPEKHHRGVGKELATAAINFLKGAGCQTIGLETNPRSNRNLGFYGKLDFVPSVLSIDMIKPVSSIVPSDKASPHHLVYYSRLSSDARRQFCKLANELIGIVSAPVDYTPLIEAIESCHQGESVLFMRNTVPIALGVLQTEPSLVEEQNALLRVISFLAHPKTPDAYIHFFLSDLLSIAREKALDRILMRLPMYSNRVFRIFLENNYRVVNSDIRMVLNGYPDTTKSFFHINRWV
ncbi:GNAT family N-acetyltransferase [candidate division KSB1 bacterium]|nr:GNAT family N-acetyltransferase [candidate division KSB1 bacterium]